MASSNLGLVPYQLSCKHGPLSAELGPPDYYPVVRGQCPEDTLNGTTAVSGYKWVPESLRINEGNESLLSLTCHNAAYWDERNTYALRQCIFHRLAAVKSQRQAVNESGQHSGSPLRLDAMKGYASTQPVWLHSASDQERSAWLHDVAAGRPLQQLVPGVPDNISRDGIFQLLVAQGMPLGRALWLVRTLYWLDPPTTAMDTAAAGGATMPVLNLSGVTGSTLASNSGLTWDNSSSSRTAQRAKLVHWTRSVLQALTSYAAVEAETRATAAKAAEAYAAADAASIAAASAASCAVAAAATPDLQESLPSHTEQYAVGAAAGDYQNAPAAVAAADVDKSMHQQPGSGVYGAMDSVAAAAAIDTAVAAEAAATAAQAHAVSAGAAATAATLHRQQGQRLAYYCFQQGLVDCEGLVKWALKQMERWVGSNHDGNSGGSCASDRNRASILVKAAMLLCEAAMQGVADCHMLAVQLCHTLLHLLDATPGHQKTHQSGGNALAASAAGLADMQGSMAVPNTGAARHSRAHAASITQPIRDAAVMAEGQNQSQAAAQIALQTNCNPQHILFAAKQLLRLLVLAAPDALVSVDCLPRLCAAALGPDAAFQVLHGQRLRSNNSSMCSSQLPRHLLHQQQQQRRQAAVGSKVESSLCAVVGTARKLAVAVNPRLLLFSKSTALRQLSSCCLSGDIQGALQAISPALKGFTPADVSDGFGLVIGIILDWACSTYNDSLQCIPWHLMPCQPLQQYGQAAIGSQTLGQHQQQHGQQNQQYNQPGKQYSVQDSQCSRHAQRKLQPAPDLASRHLFACRLLLKLHDKYQRHLQQTCEAKQPQHSQEPQVQQQKPLRPQQLHWQSSTGSQQHQHQQHNKKPRHSSSGAPTKPDSAAAAQSVGQASHNKHNKVPKTKPAAVPKTTRNDRASSLLLQPFLVAWLAGDLHSRASSSSLSCAGHSITLMAAKTGLDSAQEANQGPDPSIAAALWIHFIDCGLLDPACYVQELAAQLTVQSQAAGNGVGNSSNTSSISAAAAVHHRHMLRHLHPQLFCFDSNSNSRKKQGCIRQAADAATKQAKSSNCTVSNSSGGSNGSLVVLLSKYWAGNMQVHALLHQQQLSSSQIPHNSSSSWQCTKPWQQYAISRRAVLRLLDSVCTMTAGDRSSGKRPVALEQQLPAGVHSFDVKAPAAKRQRTPNVTTAHPAAAAAEDDAGQNQANTQGPAAIAAAGDMPVQEGHQYILNSPAMPAAGSCTEQAPRLLEVQARVWAWLGLPSVLAATSISSVAGFGRSAGADSATAAFSRGVVEADSAPAGHSMDVNEADCWDVYGTEQRQCNSSLQQRHQQQQHAGAPDQQHHHSSTHAAAGVATMQQGSSSEPKQSVIRAVGALRPWQKAVLARRLLSASQSILFASSAIGARTGLDTGADGSVTAGSTPRIPTSGKAAMEAAQASAPPAAATAAAATSAAAADGSSKTVAHGYLAGPCAALWLQRLSAVLVTADAAADTVMLMLRLLDRMVQQEFKQQQEGQLCMKSAGAHAGSIAITIASAPGKMQSTWLAHLPLACVLALLEGLQDVVAAAGLLPLLLETCVGWAAPVHNAAPSSIASNHVASQAGAVVMAAGRLLAGRYTAPDVKKWWQQYQARLQSIEAGHAGKGSTAAALQSQSSQGKHWVLHQMAAAVQYHRSALVDTSKQAAAGLNDDKLGVSMRMSSSSSGVGSVDDNGISAAADRMQSSSAPSTAAEATVLVCQGLLGSGVLRPGGVMCLPDTVGTAAAAGIQAAAEAAANAAIHTTIAAGETGQDLSQLSGSPAHLGLRASSMSDAMQQLYSRACFANCSTADQQQLLLDCVTVAMWMRTELAAIHSAPGATTGNGLGALTSVLATLLAEYASAATAASAGMAGTSCSPRPSVEHTVNCHSTLTCCFTQVVHQLQRMLLRDIHAFGKLPASHSTLAIWCGIERGLARALLGAAKQLLMNGPPPARQNRDYQQQQWVMNGIMAAVASGQVLLPDVINELLQPVLQDSRCLTTSSNSTGGGTDGTAFQRMVLEAVLSSSCWCQPAQQSQQQPRQQQRQQQQQQGTSEGYPGVSPCSDPGQGSTLCRLQTVLPQNAVISVLQQPLVAAVLSGLSAAAHSHSSSSDNTAAPEQQQEQDNSLVAAVAAVISHAPIRACLLTDIKLLYSRLATVPAQMLTQLLGSVHGTADTVLWALPQRLAVQSVLLGSLQVMTVHGLLLVDSMYNNRVHSSKATGNTGRPFASVQVSTLWPDIMIPPAQTTIGDNKAASTITVRYLLPQLALLSELNKGLLNPDLAWLLLRLLLDEQVVMNVTQSRLQAIGAPGGSSSHQLSVTAAGVSTVSAHAEWLQALEAALPLMPGGSSKNSSTAAPAVRQSSQSTAAAGATTASAAAAANTAVASSSADAAIGNAEKGLVDMVLLLLARCPAAAVAATEVLTSVVPSAGEYLLQRIDWLLQDRNGAWLSGSCSLTELLGRLEVAQVLAAVEAASTAPLAPKTAASSAEQKEGAASTASNVNKAPGVTCAAPPFAAEAALADVALLVLSRASLSKQKEFAAGIVRQILWLSDMLQKVSAPPTGAAAAATPAAQSLATDSAVPVEVATAATVSRPAAAAATPPPPQPTPALPPARPSTSAKAAPSDMTRPTSAVMHTPSPRPPQIPPAETAETRVMYGRQGSNTPGAYRPGYGQQCRQPPPPLRPVAPAPPPLPRLISTMAMTAMQPAVGTASGSSVPAGSTAAAAASGSTAANAAAPKQRRFGAAISGGRGFGRLGTACNRMSDSSSLAAAATALGSNPNPAGNAASPSQDSNDQFMSHAGPGTAASNPGKASSYNAAAAAAAGAAAVSDISSTTGVQVSLWLRVRLLLPLLPIVRADREPDNRKNQRVLLSQALIRVLQSPMVCCSTEVCSNRDDGSSSTDETSSAVAGQTLFDQLLLVLSALMSNEWAGWLKGSNKRLREVPSLDELVAAARADIEMSAVSAHVVTAFSQQVKHPPMIPVSAVTSKQQEQQQREQMGMDSQQQPRQRQQQQRDWGSLGCSRTQKISRCRQRLLAALPSPGVPQLQLHSAMSLVPLSLTYAVPSQQLQKQQVLSIDVTANMFALNEGKAVPTDHLAPLLQQQQHQLQQTVATVLTDIWQPVRGMCNISVGPPSAAAASSSGRGPTSTEQVGSGSAVLAGMLLQGCVKKSREVLPYCAMLETND